MKVIAACHIHSDWSYDGKWSLDRVALEFSARGYRILLMTEHDRGFSADRLRRYRQACAAASTDRMLVVPGIEYSDAGNLVHILTWGARSFLGESRATASLLQDVAAEGGVAVLAHPSRRSAWQVFDSAWSDYLLGIEVWNRKSDGWAPCRVAGEVLRQGNFVPFVGIDFHDHRQLFPLSMEVDCSDVVTEASILNALRQRRCRALALGHPVERSGTGLLGQALRSAEFCRRASAKTYRLCRNSIAA